MKSPQRGQNWESKWRGRWIKICRFASVRRVPIAGPAKREGENDHHKYGFDFLTRRNNKVTARTLAALIPSGRWNKAGGDLSLIWRHKIPCWKSQRAPAESINTNYQPPLKARINSTLRHHYQTADKMLESHRPCALACVAHTHTEEHVQTLTHTRPWRPLRSLLHTVWFTAELLVARTIKPPAHQSAVTVQLIEPRYICPPQPGLERVITRLPAQRCPYIFYSTRKKKHNKGNKWAPLSFTLRCYV